MSALPGTTIHLQLAIQKSMLQASTHTEISGRDGAIVATCSICDKQRTFQTPANLWDVLDMMGHHYRSSHQ